MTLAVNKLAYERNDLPLLSNIDIRLQKGELLQVRGANGSGKSTLLRILAGYIEPQEGSVLWKETCVLQQRETYQSQIHYIGHQNGIKPYLTVYENLQFYLAMYHLPASSNTITSALKQVELLSVIDSYTLTLSAGQQRRLALARLLLRSCALWILDEPTTALDVSGQQLFTHLLIQHLAQGGIAIVSTHHDFQLPDNTQILQLREKQLV